MITKSYLSMESSHRSADGDMRDVLFLLWPTRGGMEA
jgi:hypothetical protein